MTQDASKQSGGYEDTTQAPKTPGRPRSGRNRPLIEVLAGSRSRKDELPRLNSAQTVALIQSIVHWERMRDNIYCGEAPNDVDCPCCQRWFDQDAACVGCPIYEHTGRPFCRNTPYREASDLFWAARIRPTKPNLNAWKIAANRMIDFMRDILKPSTNVK